MTDSNNDNDDDQPNNNNDMGLVLPRIELMEPATPDAWHRLLSTISQFGASLNKHYLAQVCAEDVRGMVQAHGPIHRGRTDTLCYVTAAAVVWLLTGEDKAAPFDGRWEAASEGEGPDEGFRVVAYASVSSHPEDAFEKTLQHVVVRCGVFGTMDSAWCSARPLTFVSGRCSPADAITMAPESMVQAVDGWAARHILFTPQRGVAERLAACLHR